VAPALVSVLQHAAVEVFVMLCLSTKHLVLGYYEVSRGTLDATLVIRETS
jgi:DNA repair protein RadC